MTFQEWFTKNQKYIDPMDMTAWLEDAFNAGHKSAVSEPDVLVAYSREDGHREWASAGAWLRKGEAIAVIDVPATPPAIAVSKPVAWMSKTGHGTYFRESITPELEELEHGGNKMWTPLYTTPPAEAKPQ